MDIDFPTFLTQSAALIAWVFVAAGIYAVVEKILGGGGKPDEPTRI